MTADIIYITLCGCHDIQEWKMVLFSIVDQDLGKLMIFLILHTNQDFPGQQ